MAATAGSLPAPAADDAGPDLPFWGLDDRARSTLNALWPKVAGAIEAMPDNPAVRTEQWRRLLTGALDAEYLRGARETGHAHHQAGLSPRDCLGGYAFVLERLVRLIVEESRWNRRQAADEAGTLIRAVMMEVDVALSTYAEATLSTQIDSEMTDFSEDFDKELSEAVDLVRHNAAGMEGAADEVLGASNHVSKEGEHVTSASEETNMNAKIIALAAEQLSQSFDQIAGKVDHATTTSHDASARSQVAQSQAQTLATASERIGAVVKLIEKIAKETRLLALNATIEAARAGDAGRGFAVVATEVKNLADQTNGATGDIRAQIEAMQSAIRLTVESIGAVAQRVTAVGDDIASIADAVTEQGVVTRDIATNAEEMAQSMQTVHERISSVALAAERSTRKAIELWENAAGLVRQVHGIQRRMTTTLHGTRFGNRRQEERVAVDVPVDCEVDNLRFHSRLDNVGMGGVQIREKQLSGADGYVINLDIQGIGKARGTIVATERETVHVRFDHIGPETRHALSQLLEHWKRHDLELVARARDTAAHIGALFEGAVHRGDITHKDLFETAYQPIPNTDPPQLLARYTVLCDRLLPDIQEPLLASNTRILFCAAVDRNGYLPTHNRKYSEAQRPGQKDWNIAHARNRRIFDDPTGLAAARNRTPVLVQTYRRDMGNGEVVTMKDISAPILVNGKHWGGFRIGCGI